MKKTENRFCYFTTEIFFEKFKKTKIDFLIYHWENVLDSSRHSHSAQMARTKQTARKMSVKARKVLNAELKECTDDMGASSKDNQAETVSDSEIPEKALLHTPDVLAAVDEIMESLGPSACFSLNDIMDKLHERFCADEATFQATKEIVKVYINDKFRSERERKRAKTSTNTDASSEQ